MQNKNFWITFIIVPGLHVIQRPSAFLNGSPVEGSTLIIEIGYTDGIILETKPIAPIVLSMLAVKSKKMWLKKKFFEIKPKHGIYNFCVLVTLKINKKNSERNGQSN